MYGQISSEGPFAHNRYRRHDSRSNLLFHACTRPSLCYARAGISCGLSGLCTFTSLSNFSYHNRIRIMAANPDPVIPTSKITCPECGHVETEIMPTDACQWFYDCKGCGALLKPKPGDCCVYCSYGSVACPPIQEGTSCCG